MFFTSGSPFYPLLTILSRLTGKCPSLPSSPNLEQILCQRGHIPQVSICFLLSLHNSTTVQKQWPMKLGERTNKDMWESKTSCVFPLFYSDSPSKANRLDLLHNQTCHATKFPATSASSSCAVIARPTLPRGGHKCAAT